MRLRPRTRPRFSATKRKPIFLLFRRPRRQSLLRSWCACRQNSLRIDQDRRSGPFKKWSLTWPTMWARTGRYDTRDVSASLELFRVLREANLALLRSLSAEEWDMFGVHTERGVESIRDIAMYFAGHDINHFQQIDAIRQSYRNDGE